MTDSPPASTDQAERPPPSFSAELPELKVMAALAGVEASAMADGFNSPLLLFRFLTLAELDRLRESFVRIAILGQQMSDACAVYAEHGQALIGEADARG